MKLVRPWRVIPEAVRIRHRDRNKDERLDLTGPDEVLADAIRIDASVQHGSSIIDVQYRVARAGADISRRQIDPAGSIVPKRRERQRLDMARQETPKGVIGISR